MAAILRPGTLQAWLQSPTSTEQTSLKRKLEATVTEVDEYSDTETSASRPPAKKQVKTSQKPKPNASGKSISKAASKNPDKEAKKLYTDTLNAIDKETVRLDKAVKKITHGNRWSLTTSNYADNVSRHFSDAKKLTATHPVIAFNLLMAMADASHGDLDATAKMCEEPGDSSKPTFRKLDELLLPLIQSREKPPSDQLFRHALPEVPHRWTSKDADVGEFKTGWPNKQQRNAMYAQKLFWEKERREARRERREACDDWMQVSL